LGAQADYVAMVREDKFARGHRQLHYHGHAPAL